MCSVALPHHTVGWLCYLLIIPTSFFFKFLFNSLLSQTYWRNITESNIHGISLEFQSDNSPSRGKQSKWHKKKQGKSRSGRLKRKGGKEIIIFHVLSLNLWGDQFNTIYSKTCLKRPLKNKTKNWFSRPIITYCRSKYCRMLQGALWFRSDLGFNSNKTISVSRISPFKCIMNHLE